MRGIDLVATKSSVSYTMFHGSSPGLSTYLPVVESSPMPAVEGFSVREINLIQSDGVSQFHNGMALVHVTEPMVFPQV